MHPRFRRVGWPDAQPRPLRRVVLPMLGLAAAASAVGAAGSPAAEAPQTSRLEVISPLAAAAIVGEPLTINVRVSNSGAGTATQVRLFHQLSQDVTFGSSGPGNCSSAGRTLSCQLPDLGPGGSVSFQLTVFPLRPGTLVDQASVASAQTGLGQTSSVSINVAPRPVLGRTVNVATLSGVAFVRTPHARRARRLLGGRTVPVGSLVDARSGKILLRAANSRRGRLQSAQFYSGEFSVRQVLGRSPLTEVRTTGPLGCAAAAASRLAHASRAPRRRRLWGNARGRFRTRGRYAAATVRGTLWLTVDTCDGTQVIVKRGVVSVFDVVAGRTVLVSAGHSYFAHAP
jgi:Domain of unknown function DUF11